MSAFSAARRVTNISAAVACSYIKQTMTKAYDAERAAPVWYQLHTSIFCVFSDAISHSHIDNKAYERSNRNSTELYTPNMDDSELNCISFFFFFFWLKATNCVGIFKKDIQSQFNDTSLHSHALITHNPLHLQAQKPRALICRGLNKILMDDSSCVCYMEHRSTYTNLLLWIWLHQAAHLVQELYFLSAYPVIKVST